MRRMAPALLAASLGLFSLSSVAQELIQVAPARGSVDRLVRDVFSADLAKRGEALAALEQRGELDVVPGLIQSLRFLRSDGATIGATLDALTGETMGGDWTAWMLWQEAHPEIEPHEGFDGFKADVMASVDPNFRVFLWPGVPHEIRLEEITWGGVVKDGIPALTNPRFTTPEEATYLGEDELVFGVEINGDARAYPLRIMDWHEMFNDVVGGVPLSLAYCTLCGSGILYETTIEDWPVPLVFGSSGFLYRSNKLMYDTATHSLWNQFTGRPVVGKLTGSGIELKARPVLITTWGDWLKRHRATKVLTINTGYKRDYRPGRPYGEYFASDNLMFPALVPEPNLAPKDFVFALRLEGHEKAWPLTAFEGGQVINDEVAGLDVVLVGDARTRTVRAYRADGRDFAPADGLDRLRSDGQEWQVREDALAARDGTVLERLPGHVAYWFAWSNFKTGSPLFSADE
ncbi:MAG: DUF3179 domain-containing protein [Alphaproteobacteria bacterium]